MSDYTAKRIKRHGGRLRRRVREGPRRAWVTAFGMQVIQLPPDYADYPEHDHAETAQEEVFVALAGSGWIDIEGERVELDATRSSASAPTRSARSTPARRACACSRSAARPGEPYEIVAAAPSWTAA